MEELPIKPKSVPSKNCFKCKSKAQLRYKNNLVVCAECFSFHVCLRAFRSVIRNQLEVFGKQNDLVVFFDGSVNSAMLAHNVEANVIDNEKVKKKMFFTAQFICFDFSELAEQVFGEKAKKLIKNQNDLAVKCFESLKLTYEIIPCSQFESIDVLVADFLRLPATGGYREDYIRILEHRFLVEYCLKNSRNKIVLPENAEQLAARALKLLCKSRHNELVPQCSISSTLTRDGQVLTFVRPLAERSTREVLFYSKMNSVVNFACDRYEWLSIDHTARMLTLPGQGSINQLLMEFITDLQGEYLSTSSTILKTTERVKEITLDSKPGLVECRVCWTVS